MMIKLKSVFAMIGQLAYYIGRDWRKLPMRNVTGIHRKQDMW